MKRALRLLIILYVFLLPLQTRLFVVDSAVEYQRVSLYGTQILFLVIFILFLFCYSRPDVLVGISSNGNPENQNKQKKDFKSFHFLFSFLDSARLDSLTRQVSKHGMTIFPLFVFFIALQLIVSSRIDLTIQTLLWILQMIFFVWIVKKENLIRPMLWAFVVSMVVQSVFIWSQFFTQSIPSYKWLGLAEHLPWQGGVSVIEAIGGRFLRGYGLFPHPNIAGGFSLLAIMALVLLSLRGKSERRSLPRRRVKAGNLPLTSPNVRIPTPEDRSPRFDQVEAGRAPLQSLAVTDKKELLLRVTSYVICVFLASGLVLTFSRSAMLGFAIFIIVQFFYALSSRSFVRDPETKNKQKKIPAFSFLDSVSKHGMTALLIVTFSLSVLTPFRELVFIRADTSSRLEQVSVIERAEYNQYAREIINNNLMLGVGLGNYGLELQKAHPELEPYKIQPPHSVPLLIVAELGFIGVILILLIIFSLLTTHYSLLTTFIPLLPLLFFDHYLWSLYAGWMLVGIVALSIFSMFDMIPMESGTVLKPNDRVSPERL